MSEETIDHKARHDAAMALQQIKAHERFCEERGRRAEIFETDMRNIHRQMKTDTSNGFRDIHKRLDTINESISLEVRKSFWRAVIALAAMVGAVLWFLADKLFM